MNNIPNELVLDHIKTVPTNKLINYISAYPEDQEIVNRCAYELTKRIWVPNKETSFDQMLYDFGFRYPESEESKSMKLGRK